MTPPSDHEVIRDPLWGDIQIDPDALAVVDCEPFQRLRYVRQLGHAFLVYPGATHTRFEHALGAYHLARRALSQLEDAGDARLASGDRTTLTVAALLHDIGHYPFSHALEEAGLPGDGHHAVRGATAMFKRLVRDAIAAGRLTAEQVAVATDDGLIHDLMQADGAGLARRLRERRLAKRAVDLPATELPADAPAWAADDPELQQHVEDRLAGEVGLRPGELFLDFPAKPDMLALDLPLVQRDGAVIQLAGADATAQLGLPRVAGELHRSARRLRVFVLGSATVSAKAIVELVMLPREEVLERVEQERSLL